MTQESSAQTERQQIAWKAQPDARTLAQRRAAFAAQMRDMALSDLTAVADRLRDLHARLERKDGRKWTTVQIADGAHVAHRTYQTWTGGHRENQDGTGYKKLARFYRRRLGDPTITFNWIVFGQEKPPEEKPTEAPAPAPDPRAEQLDRIEEKLDELLRRVPATREDAQEGGGSVLPAEPPPLPSPEPTAPTEAEPPNSEEESQQKAE